ncbi:SGNH/GDSL hydrolase family protein [Janthinobacterium sp.]|uniref:SGNH/GDSL hydrolase family protein n=1 Tax=Janthinobacterium sp. TaxID=1871054 RepID=UPI00289FE14B|nr:SGNH/GDSL hydrolase family protein [Janthinobacterium sp.]
MPTIIAGSTPQTITLPEGRILNVSGATGTTGTLYRLDPVLGGTNSLQSWPIGAGAMAPIGPYAGQQRFLVSCSVGIVDIGTGSGAVGAVQSVMLANGLSIMGDSYAANNYGGALNNFVSTQTSGIIVTADELLGGVFDINQMVAIGGKSAREMLTEQLPAVLLRRNRYVYLSAGYNDIYGTDNATGQAAAAFVIQIIQALIANGQIPIWHTVGARTYSASKIAGHMACNAALRDFARANACGVFLDLFMITVDPITPPGALSVRSGWTLDGVNHWNLLAAYYASKALAVRLRPLIQLPNQLPAGSEDSATSPATNTLKNVIFAGSSGTFGANITGPVPTNWDVSWATRTGTGVANVSVVDIVDADTGLVTARGLTVALSSGATAAGDVLSISQNDGVTPIVAGQLISAAARLSLASPSFVNEATIRAQANVNESTWAGNNAAKSGAGSNPDYPESATFTRRTRRIAALVTGTITKFDARISFSGPATSGSYTLSQPRLRKD